MIKTLTLNQAISTAFDIDGRKIPDFTSSKPLLEARNWLARQGVEFDYQRATAANGILVFTRGAGSPQYAVIDNETEMPGGILALATLSPKSSSKAPKNEEDAAQVQNDAVESAPTITNAPNGDVDSEMTVTNPKPRNKRSSRKK